jgi:tRNA threonylcarbamoyladenosine biosynthesis protein TsaE
MIIEHFLTDEEATQDLARQLMAALPAIDRPLIVYLQGDLGAGKTSFTRGALHALGHEGAVRSPTYGLVSEYALPAGLVYHFDLYRLQGEEELEALALRDLLWGSRLWLIEWPERGGAGLPPADLRLALQVRGQGRDVRLESLTVPANQWLGAAFGSSSA